MINIIKWKLQGRSSQWRHIRALHLSYFPACAACDSRKKLEVHHIIPFDVNPSRELDNTNLVTLCKQCHLVIGHLRDYTLFNQFVSEDIRNYRSRRLIARALREEKKNENNRD